MLVERTEKLLRIRFDRGANRDRLMVPQKKERSFVDCTPMEPVDISGPLLSCADIAVFVRPNVLTSVIARCSLTL